MPCKPYEFFEVRLIERDYCNDDMNLVTIPCQVTNVTQALNITIARDDTSYTSHSQCMSVARSTINKVGVDLGGVFGAANPFGIGAANSIIIERGEQECAEVGSTETSSEYVLTYEVTDGPCGVALNSTDTNVGCFFDQYYPSQTCNTTV